MGDISTVNLKAIYHYRLSRDKGGSRDVVECPICGYINKFYVWSWAGNGMARCKGCKAEIIYGTLEVIAHSKETVKDDERWKNPILEGGASKMTTEMKSPRGIGTLILKNLEDADAICPVIRQKCLNCPVIRQKCLERSCQWFDQNIEDCIFVGMWGLFFTLLSLAGVRLKVEENHD